MSYVVDRGLGLIYSLSEPDGYFGYNLHCTIDPRSCYVIYSPSLWLLSVTCDLTFVKDSGRSSLVGERQKGSTFLPKELFDHTKLVVSAFRRSPSRMAIKYVTIPLQNIAQAHLINPDPAI